MADPNPTNYPILSYILTRIPSIGSPRQPKSPSSSSDIEQPAISTRSPKSDPTFHDTLISRMPHLKDPNIINEMSATVSKIAKTRSVLQTLGTRPDHESVDVARSRIAEMESRIASIGEEISAEEREKEKFEREITMYKAIVQVDETHDTYEKLLRGAEEKLMRIYDRAVAKRGAAGDGEEEVAEVNEEVVRVLKEADNVENVDLSGQKLRILPEAFGKLACCSS